MKLLFENWRKFVNEAKLQEVDWEKGPYGGKWPPGAQEAWKKAMALQKAWRKRFVAKTKAGDSLKADPDRTVGETSLKMLQIFYDAGFVPPKMIVDTANTHRQHRQKMDDLEGRKPGTGGDWEYSRDNVLAKAEKLEARALKSGDVKDLDALAKHYLLHMEREGFHDLREKALKAMQNANDAAEKKMNKEFAASNDRYDKANETSKKIMFINGFLQDRYYDTFSKAASMAIKDKEKALEHFETSQRFVKLQRQLNDAVQKWDDINSVPDLIDDMYRSFKGYKAK